jgi:hypothetical protein
MMDDGLQPSEKISGLLREEILIVTGLFAFLVPKTLLRSAKKNDA